MESMLKWVRFLGVYDVELVRGWELWFKGLGVRNYGLRV